MGNGSITSELWCKARLSTKPPEHYPSRDEEMCAFFITAGWGGNPDIDFLNFGGWGTINCAY